MDRGQVQSSIVDKFCELPFKRALVVAGTGVGKTKIAIDIVKKLRPANILYLVESKNNRDKTAPDEFKKWGAEDILEKVTFMTYQMAHRLLDTGKNLDGYFVIADEVDFAFTKEYGTFFTDYPHLEVFAMTGFVTQAKYRMFRDTLPMLFKLTSMELQEAAVLNPTRFVFVQYTLGKTRDIKVEYTKGGQPASFMTSENDSYKYFAKQEEKVTAQLMQALNDNNAEVAKKLEDVLYKVIPHNRAANLWQLNSSVDLTRRLIAEILEKDISNKVITFSERTAQADKISKNGYHGKVAEKVADKVFDDFCKGKIRVMSTCSKVDRGANIDNLNYAILESYTTDITKFQQRNGRLMRLDLDRVGTIYVLMPYYTDNGKAYPTRAVHWARDILKAFGKPEVSVLNYCGAYEVQK